MKNEIVRLLYCGDPHGHFSRVIEVAQTTRPSSIILLGDLEPSRPLNDELAPIFARVHFIHGNHDTDTDEVAERVWHPSVADRNVHGRVVTLPDGTRLAGLGGVFRGNVWNPNQLGKPKFRNQNEHARATSRKDRWHGGVPRTHWSTIYPDEVDRLAKLRADVLVTHEAPKGAHPFGFAVLDELAQSMRVKLIVHGHHHDSLDSSASWQKQGFMTFGVGLRGITTIDLSGHSEVIVPGEPSERNIKPNASSANDKFES